MKTKYWILLLAGIFALCLGLSLWLFWPREHAVSVKVISDGEVVRELPLAVDTTLTVQTERGTNVITVRDGKVAVTEADCPDGYCMERGFCDSGASIVCLPNRLVLEFSDTQRVDGVVG